MYHPRGLWLTRSQYVSLFLSREAQKHCGDGITSSNQPNEHSKANKPSPKQMLYGPNTNLGHNSIILMIEAQSRYINSLIAPVLSARSANLTLSLSPKASVVTAYNARIQAVLQNSSFNDPECNSWYKNEAGLITNNWSGTVVEYQKQLEKVDFGEYEVEGSGTEVVKGGEEVRKVGRVREETLVGDKWVAVLGVVSVGAVAAGWVLRNSRGLRIR